MKSNTSVFVSGLKREKRAKKRSEREEKKSTPKQTERANITNDGAREREREEGVLGEIRGLPFERSPSTSLPGPGLNPGQRIRTIEG